MTRFRYDVVLHVEPGQCPGPCPPDVWRDWRDAPLDASAIRERLASAQPSYFGLRRVTNARLATELRIKRWLAEDAGGDTVGALRLAIDEAPRLGVDPEALWELAQGLPYAVDIRCEPESADGDIAVLFTRYGSPPVDIDTVVAAPPRPFADCANNPLREKASRAFVPELMRDLKAALPQHMIPASIVMLDSFPLLPNGKVDRQALPPPDFDTLYREQYVAPHTATQQAVQSIWAAVLGVDNPGIHDNFFALGGHSLKVTQVVSRIAQDLKKTVSLRDFFNQPTIAELAALLDEVPSDSAAEAIPAAPPAPDYPVSPAQQRLWVLAQMDGGAAYHMADTLVVRGHLDANALARAYGMLLQRHEILRTGFVEVAGALRQRVYQIVDPTFETVDLRGARRADRRSPQARARRRAQWIRSGQRAAGQDAPAAHRQPRVRAAVQHASHHFGRLEHGRAGPRDDADSTRPRSRGGRLRCRRCASSIATTSPGRRRACVRACSSCANTGEASSAICRPHSTCRPTSRVRRCAPAAAAACTCDWSRRCMRGSRSSPAGGR